MRIKEFEDANAILSMKGQEVWKYNGTYTRTINRCGEEFYITVLREYCNKCGHIYIKYDTKMQVGTKIGTMSVPINDKCPFLYCSKEEYKYNCESCRNSFWNVHPIDFEKELIYGLGLKFKW